MDRMAMPKPELGSTSRAQPHQRMRTFTGAALAQIAFPLGGIGTGTVSLGGRGNLQDWEIFNRPGKGDTLMRTFFALRLEKANGEVCARVLEREFLPPFVGALGFRNHQLAGLPRFREAVFAGEYPFAKIDFQDDDVPAQVSLEAFNPFVPLDVEASSIPGFILKYRIRNTQSAPIRVSLLATMMNPAGAPMREFTTAGMGIKDSRWAQFLSPGEAARREENGLVGVFFSNPNHSRDATNFGSAALSTPWPRTTVQTAVPGGWMWDCLELLWRQFTVKGGLEPRGETSNVRWDPAALCLRAELAAGAEVELPVFVHWHFTNARLWGGDTTVAARTFVSNQFADAWDAAAKTHSNFASLDKKTRAWHRTFFSSTLPAAVLDAASSQLSTLRSPTVMRLADGAIYAWEGCGDAEGSCAGNCTHVWNYEQALAELFPSLERTMRAIEFGPNMNPDGSMAFRCDAPAAAVTSNFRGILPCVDGQMGAVMQAYRDWKLSGDEGFLRALWPNIKRALEYAWTKPGGWDPNKDGLIEGVQHNTYDIEFYGPNAMLGSVYLGALRAAEEMARHLGEEAKAAEYRRIFESGRALTERELWNGEYFVQKVAVADGVTVPTRLVTPGTEQAPFPKYQYGEGCLSDQLIGQWEAHVMGLGYLLDPKKVRAAVQAIHRHNFKSSLRQIQSVQRVYALGDEAGLLLCSWPNGGRPALPFVYSDEVWTGIEYEVAALLFYEGFLQEGLQIVEAVRARYDGLKRNPWNEIECGNHYARALSSWSLVQALSGVRYSAVDLSLTFNPRLAPPLRCFVAAGTAWGCVEITEDEISFEVIHGELSLRRFGLSSAPVEYEAARRFRVGEHLREQKRKV